MLKSPYLFAVSVLLALLNWTGLAYAKDTELALSFDLPPVKEAIAHKPSVDPPSIKSPNLPAHSPIEEDIQIAQLTYPTAELPPIESQPLNIGMAAAKTRQANTSTDIALTFAEDDISVQSPSKAEAHNVEAGDLETHDLLESFVEKNIESSESEAAQVSFESFDGWRLDDWIFEHGSDSLVARTVGSAEGTRQANGRRTPAYFGHVDPGNGVWNLGTFSYQHEADSPEDADSKQLRRLKRQGLQLESQAKSMGITLSLKEKLNGLDLANQAPLAALDKGGYIERLAQARRLNMEENEAILWARTYAYIDPDTRRWNAPGLGNNVHSISRDQERRIGAIADAMKAYNPQDVQITALENLERITLETTASLDVESIRERSLENPIEITFDLPAVDSGLMQAALSSTPKTAAQNTDTTSSNTMLQEPRETVAAIDRLAQNVERPQNIKTTQNVGTQNVDTQNVEQSGSNVVSGIESTAESTVTSELSGDIGIAFMPTHEITSQGNREHHERNDLFSIDSTPTSDEVSSVNEVSLTYKKSTSETLHALQPHQTHSTDIEPAEKLQSLVDGITTRRLDSEERDRLLKKDSETVPTDNSTKTYSNIRLWHIEDSISSNK